MWEYMFCVIFCSHQPDMWFSERSSDHGESCTASPEWDGQVFIDLFLTAHAREMINACAPVWSFIVKGPENAQWVIQERNEARKTETDAGWLHFRPRHNYWTSFSKWTPSEFHLWSVKRAQRLLEGHNVCFSCQDTQNRETTSRIILKHLTKYKNVLFFHCLFMA